MKKWNILVIIDGHVLKAIGDGTEEGTIFQGREEDIAMAKAVIRHKFDIYLGSEMIAPQIRASYDTALGLTAALMGASPTKTVLWRAPQEVLQFIDSYVDIQMKSTS